MPSLEIESALNLSGEWTGAFSYPIRRPTVAFTARLIDEDGWISGVSEDHGSTPDVRGFLLGATLQGRRTGNQVSWLKVYDKIWKTHYSVAYEGVISADGREIAGRWSIPRGRSGAFVMNRRPGLASAISPAADPAP